MKYIVYKFPSLYGTPKKFRTYIGAVIYTLLSSKYMYELRNIETGEYKAYWR